MTVPCYMTVKTTTGPVHLLRSILTVFHFKYI